MTQLETFLNRCDVVAARLGVARATLSDRLLSDGRRLSDLAAGKDIGFRRLQRADIDLRKIEVELGIIDPAEAAEDEAQEVAA